MKIYFAGSIRGGRIDAVLYQRIISYIERTDTVLSRYAGDPANGDAMTDAALFAQDAAWLRACDCVLAECSNPSLGVGYELACAERLGKPTHIFYNRFRNQLSAMLSGNGYFRIHPYDEEREIYPVIDGILGRGT